MSLITISNVSKVFNGQVVAIDNIDLSINRGDFVFIIGRSGAGKSTLLKLITREVKPTSGLIAVDGEDITEISNRNMPFYRRKFGVIWQESKMLQEWTVFDNVALAMRAVEKPEKSILKSVPNALGLVGIRKKANFLPQQLSGRELFKVALARALINNPPILIADEPTANLDADTSWDIMCLLEEVNRLGTTIVLATHAQELVDIMKKRVITLDRGKIIRDVKRGYYGLL